MRTEQLIGLLAHGAGAAPRAVAARRLTPAVLFGLLASAGLAVALLGLVPPAVLAGSALWVKLAYGAALAAAALWWMARLARPAAATAAPARAVAIVIAVMGLLGLGAWGAAPAGERWTLLLGHSWAVCPWAVLALSLPALAGGLWALRGLAPTRPRRAGLAVGLLAGALGVLGYSLACPEEAIAFIATWYTLGIGLSAALGGWLGPRVLRW